jgi:hypothetical protein
VSHLISKTVDIGRSGDFCNALGEGYPGGTVEARKYCPYMFTGTSTSMGESTIVDIHDKSLPIVSTIHQLSLGGYRG